MTKTAKARGGFSPHGHIHELAFDAAVQANIISNVSDGQIVLANRAACRLLGYSRKEMIEQKRGSIIKIKDASFQAMLRRRKTHGSSTGFVTAIKKNGSTFPCELSSAVFTDTDGIEKAISTITDRSRQIHKQEVIDTQKAKLVTRNIVRAQQKSDASLAEHNEWIKYIAKTSYDVMWDWDVSTGEVYVGDSVEEVFGYKVTNNLVQFSDFIKCLPAEERAAVRRKIMRALNSGAQRWSGAHGLRRYDGTLAAALSRASIVRDDNGKALRLIGAIQDTSRIQDLEKKLTAEEHVSRKEKHKFSLASRLSRDVFWEWNISADEMYLGDGFEALFGYHVCGIAGTLQSWLSYFDPGDRPALQKAMRAAMRVVASHWQGNYRIVRADASVANVLVKASVIRQANGKASQMIGIIHDLSLQYKLEAELKLLSATSGAMQTGFNERFNLLFNSSPDVLFDVDLLADTVLVSDAYEKEFGYASCGKPEPAAIWSEHIHPDDKAAVMMDYSRMLASAETEWKYPYRFIKADGSVTHLISSGVILRDITGKAYRMIGSMHDVSRQSVLEEKLEHEILVKESQMREAVSEAREAERSDIGKELHDNVNQLLGASKLYLELAKRGGENSEMYLGRSSEYTLTAIEEIRNLTKGLTTDIIRELGFVAAVSKLAHDTMETSPLKISLLFNKFRELSLSDKFKLNLFRIVQEAMNNIIKYAQAETVSISVRQTSKTITMLISDNGIGFDTTLKSRGIGMDNIKSRATHFAGTARFTSQPGKGCSLSVVMPASASQMLKNI